MINGQKQLSTAEVDEKVRLFEQRCRQSGLKVTPQRVLIYKELVKTDEHPSADRLYEKVKRVFPSISLDTVNRTLLMLSEKGLACMVEGAGDARRFDAEPAGHQHFRCVQCKRIIDFHYEPFDHIELPPELTKKFTVLRKTVYVEGVCDLCRDITRTK